MLTLKEFEDSLFHFVNESVDIVLKYYRKGKLEKIGIVADLYVSEGYTTLRIDGIEQLVPYEWFKGASEKNERDRQRECYFTEETEWTDFFNFMKNDYQAISESMERLEARLRERWKVEVEIEVEEG